MPVKKAFFIADLHLEAEARPQVIQHFLSFLELVRQQRGDLYILGDLFDYWANNRLLYQKYQPVWQGLQRLRQSGSQITLLYGNRDFLLKSYYAASFGVDFVGESHAQYLDGHHIWMTHGDQLCTTATKLERYKPIWQTIFRLLDNLVPGWLENYVAQKIRGRSQKVVANLDPAAFVLNNNLLKYYFAQGYDTIICGHIHRSQIREYPEGKRLIILPAWETEGGYCELEGGRFSLQQYKP